MEEKLRLARQKRFGTSSEKLLFQGDFFRVFKPLINLIRTHQVSGDYLQGDESRLQVHKETGNGLTRIGCWDHARRKFVEASQAMPALKKGAKGARRTWR
jgi:hypothetical protein